MSELLDEERVAAALEQHGLEQRRLDRVAKTPYDHLARFGLVQGYELDSLGCPTRLPLRAARGNEQTRQGCQVRDQVLERGLTGRIHPVHVFRHDQQRSQCHLPAKRVPHDFYQDPPACLRIEVRRRVAEHVEQEPHGREIEVETELVHARFDGGPCDRLLVGLPDAQGASEQARE